MSKVDQFNTMANCQTQQSMSTTTQKNNNVDIKFKQKDINESGLKVETKKYSFWLLQKLIIRII